MRGKARYIQLASEALIPLLGYFLWEWNLYFIILFYFIDMVTDEFIMHLKTGQIYKHQHPTESKKQWVKWGTMSLLLFVTALFLIHLSLLQIMDGIDFKTQIIEFWEYEELGIQQGYLLVPLVLFVSFQQYKMEFLMRAEFRNTTKKELWKRHHRALLVLLGFTGLALGLSQIVEIPELVYVLLIVTLTILYKLKGNVTL